VSALSGVSEELVEGLKISLEPVSDNLNRHSALLRSADSVAGLLVELGENRGEFGSEVNEPFGGRLEEGGVESAAGHWSTDEREVSSRGCWPGVEADEDGPLLSADGEQALVETRKEFGTAWPSNNRTMGNVEIRETEG
jgi:hypothetical protein